MCAGRPPGEGGERNQLTAGESASPAAGNGTCPYKGMTPDPVPAGAARSNERAATDGGRRKPDGRLGRRTARVATRRPRKDAAAAAMTSEACGTTLAVQRVRNTTEMGR